MNEDYFHLNNCKKCGSDLVCYDEKLFLKDGVWGGTVKKHKALCLNCKNSTGWYEKAEKARDAWNKGMTKKKSPKKAAFTAK